MIWAESRGDINKIIDSARSQLPRGSRVVIRGQVQTMRSSYTGLLIGLAVCDYAGLPADRSEFPILARSFHHDLRVTGGAWPELHGSCSSPTPL